MRAVTASRFSKMRLPPTESANVLMAANSRYEDWRAKRIYINDALDEPVIVEKRKRVVGAYAPDPSLITPDMLERLGINLRVPAWVRPPLILPRSLAPWSLEPGREYILASGIASSPAPKVTSRTKVLEWQLANAAAAPHPAFMPPTYLPDPASITPADEAEINIRLWNDMRGPGPQRQVELQATVMRYLLRGASLDPLVHLLPTDSGALNSVITTPPDYALSWPGKEEAIWTSLLDDPDIDRFYIDPAESVAWESTKNLFFEADNLVALKALRRGYEAKVKLTYIDPPYNTGGNFVYNDDFKATENSGSPFRGARWARGTWRDLKSTEWFNYEQLAAASKQGLVKPTDGTFLSPPDRPSVAVAA